MKGSTHFLAISALILLTGLQAAAQQEAELIFRDGRAVEGVLLDASPDSVSFIEGTEWEIMKADAAAVRMRLAWDDILRAEIGPGGSVAADILVGTGIGAVTGIVLGVGVAQGNGDMQGLAAAAAAGLLTIAGGVVGTIVGVTRSHEKWTYFPSIEYDRHMLLQRCGARIPVDDSRPTAQSLLTLAEDSVPVLNVALIDGRDIPGYLLDVGDEGITILREDWKQAENADRSAEMSVAFDSLASVHIRRSGSWLLWAVLGGLAGPLVIPTPDGSPVMRTVGEVAVGALVFGGSAFLLSGLGEESWEWDPKTGDRDFLLRFALSPRILAR